MSRIRDMAVLKYYGIQKIEIIERIIKKVLNTPLKASMYVQP